MARIIDCSMIVSNKMWRSPWKVNISYGKREVHEVEGVKVQYQGAYIHMSVHSGSHIDSPLHMIQGGPTIGELPIERCCGEAAVVDLMYKGELNPITAEDLEKQGKHIRKGDIVLLKTGWTEKNAGGDTERMEGLPVDWDYFKGPYPTRSMAEWMVKKRVKAVGYDCPNECTQHLSREYDHTRKGPKPGEEEYYVHIILLSHGILQIEYLCNLTAIKKDRVKFFAVPLKLSADGSPVRAFAIEE